MLAQDAPYQISKPPATMWPLPATSGRGLHRVSQAGTAASVAETRSGRPGSHLSSPVTCATLNKRHTSQTPQHENCRRAYDVTRKR